MHFMYNNGVFQKFPWIKGLMERWKDTKLGTFASKAILGNMTSVLPKRHLFHSLFLFLLRSCINFTWHIYFHRTPKFFQISFRNLSITAWPKTKNKHFISATRVQPGSTTTETTYLGAVLHSNWSEIKRTARSCCSPERELTLWSQIFMRIFFQGQQFTNAVGVCFLSYLYKKTHRLRKRKQTCF